MMKKWLAVPAALAMMLCLAGCGDVVTEDPAISDIAQETPAPENELSFPMTMTLVNSDELLNFIECINTGTPVTYENVMDEGGTEVTYTLTYDGSSCLIEASAVQNGEEMTASAYVAQFGMLPMTTAFTDMFGNFDEASYEAQLNNMGLSLWAQAARHELDENLYVVYAVLAQGNIIVFDYYVNTPVA